MLSSAVNSSNVPIGSMAQKMGEHPYIATAGPELLRSSYLLFSTISQFADYNANLKLAEANVLFKDLSDPQLSPDKRESLRVAFDNKINYGRNLALFTANYGTASKFDQVLLAVQRTPKGEIVSGNENEIKEIEAQQFESVLRNELQKIKLDNKVMSDIRKADEEFIMSSLENNVSIDPNDSRLKNVYTDVDFDFEDSKKLTNIIETAVQQGISLETAISAYQKMKSTGEISKRSQRVVERAFISSKINSIEKKYNEAVERKGGYNDIKSVKYELDSIKLGRFGFNNYPTEYRKKRQLELKIQAQLRALRS